MEETSQPPPPLSKNAQKRLLKQQRYESRKQSRKAKEKARKQQNLEQRRKEWAEKLENAATEEEKERLIAARKDTRKERMGKRAEERGMKLERLNRAKEIGQNVVIDLEFADLMTPTEIHSLVHQIMYCYAVNGRCPSPAHLWLTGCRGEMEAQIQKIPGFDKWIIEKESRSYIEALEDQKENLVYLTADAESVVDELDPKKIYIVGGLVDRNRWKGVTMKKAVEQGIQTAKLPIVNYLKMSSSQVLTVNQVVEILLKFLETKDWKDAFFQVIPQRKRDEGQADTETEVRDEEAKLAAEIARLDGDDSEKDDAGEEEDEDDCVRKKQRTIEAEAAVETAVGDAEKSEMENKPSIKEATNGVRVES